MIKVGIIAAMDKEFKMFENIKTSKNLSDNIVIEIIKCGIGKVNAAVETERFIHRFKPNIIISSGVAGGIGEDIQIMDTVAAETVCYHDVWCGFDTSYGQVQGLPLYFETPKKLIEKITSLNIRTLKIGLTVSGDYFIDTKQKAMEIKSKFPLAKAVDMESGAIAQVCYLNNVKFLSLRTISDLPLGKNNSKEYVDFWNKITASSFSVAKNIIMNISLEDLK